MRAAVYNGRFSFPTIAHKGVIRFGVDNFDELIIIVGSATTATNEKNPLTYDERSSILGDMIQNMGFKYHQETNTFYTPDGTKTVAIRPNSDYEDDADWVSAMYSIVSRELVEHSDTVTIINPEKDAGNYWLKYFTDWEYQSAPMVDGVSASRIRSRFFHGNANYVENATYETVMFLEKWKHSEECRRIRAEFLFHEQIRKAEAARIEHNRTAKEKGHSTKYQTTYVTGDCAIMQRRGGKMKILLITRKNIPGVGQKAIPGGHFEPAEDNSEYDTAVREAREEIGVQLTDKEFAEFAVATQIRFGAVDRSLRGRILTMLQVFLIPEGMELELTPQEEEVIDGGWFEQHEVKQSECFEDHYYMVNRAFAEAAKAEYQTMIAGLTIQARLGDQTATEELLKG